MTTHLKQSLPTDTRVHTDDCQQTSILGILVICEHEIAYFTAYNGIFKITNIYLCI